MDRLKRLKNFGAAATAEPEPDAAGGARPPSPRRFSLSQVQIEWRAEDLAVYKASGMDLGFQKIMETPHDIDLTGRRGPALIATLEKLNHAGLNASLRSLCLAKTNIGMLAEGEALTAVIKDTYSNLVNLNLRECAIGARGATGLGLSLKLATSLEKLNISVNSLGNPGATSLAVALPSLRNLDSLDLGYNMLGPEGAASLALGLSTCRKITNLSFEVNMIAAEGTRQLALLALPQQAQLARLNLSCNMINIDGTRALVRGLAGCSSLRELRLRQNALGDEGADLLFGGLCVPNIARSLQVLDVSDNRISILPRQVTQLTALIVLSLERNPFVTPPQEVVDEGIGSLTAFFSEQET